MTRLSRTVVALLMLASAASADVLRLRDGSSVEGEVKRSGDNYTVKLATGEVKTVPIEKVLGIDVKPAAGPDAVMARLQSLRRAADNMPDIKQILDRYHSFVDQNAGTPAADAAQKDVALWQDRLDHQMVKVGDKWMTPQERDGLRAKSVDIAVLLHDMIKQGRLKEATPILERALQVDPQNISLQYLQGVLSYQQEALPAARKAFEAVISTAPDHAPTLNNLGVILWRQKAPTAALGFYDRALLAAPQSQDILDNIAEALNDLPKEQRDTPVVRKLVRHFKEQDDAMQKKMSEKGYFRWGSEWVPEKELKKLQDTEKQVQDQIKQMQADFDTVQKRIAAIDRQIAEITNEMNLLDAQTYAQDGAGRVVRLPYPPLYYTLGQQLATLRAERAQHVDELEGLRKSAKAAQGQLPQPKYLGQQKLIDADGVPLPAGARLPAPLQPMPPAPGGNPAPPGTNPAAPGAGANPGEPAGGNSPSGLSPVPPADAGGPTTRPVAPIPDPSPPPTTRPVTGSPRLPL